MQRSCDRENNRLLFVGPAPSQKRKQRLESRLCFRFVENACTTEGPTGPGYGSRIHAIIIRMFGPPYRKEFRYALLRQAWHGNADLWGLGFGRCTQTPARIASLADQQDGGAMQHQAFQVLDGHGRPPAIKGEEFAGTIIPLYREETQEAEKGSRKNPQNLESGYAHIAKDAADDRLRCECRWPA